MRPEFGRCSYGIGALHLSDQQNYIRLKARKHDWSVLGVLIYHLRAPKSLTSTYWTNNKERD